MEKTWAYDLNDARIVWDGGHIDLSPHEDTAFGLLDSVWPHKVSLKKMTLAFYPLEMPDADVPDDPRNVIHATISHLRRKLIESVAPFSIPHGNHAGWCIEAKPYPPGYVG